MTPNNGRVNGFKTRYMTTAETPKKYLKMSKRLYFRRRYHMRNKPLMIIYFEGVLGFIAKSHLYFRPGVVKFIAKARINFQIVMISTFSTKRNTTIREILERKGIYLDAIYRFLEF
jgi:hypothetical protein